MKWYKTYLTLAIIATFFSCDTNKTENTLKSNNKDTSKITTQPIVYEDRRENLPLSIHDTIKKSASYFFSNTTTKDEFQLSIEPVMVKNAKAILKIITANHNLIYKQDFDAYFFVQGIFEPDSIPADISQDAYDAYIDKYGKSISMQQYETYFKKNVDSFFQFIYPIKENTEKDLNAWGSDILDKDFMQEALRDTTIQLFDITCFTCKEGGAIIGYSRKQNKVVTLLEHD